MPKSAQDSEDGYPSGLKFPTTATARANLCVAGSDIMTGDSAPDGNAHYSGFTLVPDMQNVDRGKRWFDNLAADGRIEMDRQETSWTHGLDKVNDQYGVPWTINVVEQQRPPTE